MFDFAFGSMMAFQSLGLIIGALICFGLGALMSGDFVYWRTRAKRTKGKIITYKEKAGQGNIFYYPVAEYRDHTGEVKRVTSDIGSSHLDDRKLGKSVTILYFPQKNGEARILGAGLPLFIIGLIFIGSGLFLFYQATIIFELNWYMAVAFLALCAWIWSKTQKVRKPISKFRDLKEFKAANLIDTISKGPGAKKGGGKELTAEEVRQIKKKNDIQQGKWSWLILLFGLILLGIGGYVAHGVWHLETNGMSADGEVTGMESSTDSEGSTTYSPIITYKTQEGKKITFTSNYGSNPPSYKTGDEVKVLYDPVDPEETVMIDAGWWNWLLPYILLGFGLALTFLLFPKMYSAGSRAR